MATSGIWNHVNPANSLAANPHVSAQPASAQPAAAAAGSSGTSGADASTITSNDFLTLLVTEMKNQDPTANNDPNAYVNQLVQVNSLEQLININQTLSTKLGNTPTAGVLPGRVASRENAQSAASPNVKPDSVAARADSSALNSFTSHAIKTTAGNLAVPNANPAAQRVAQALGHRTRLD